VNSVHERGSAIKGRILVALTGQQHPEAFGFKSDPGSSREIQDNIALGQTGSSARTKVGPPVGRIQNDG
jgi:hypothetical protein